MTEELKEMRKKLEKMEAESAEMKAEFALQAVNNFISYLIYKFSAFHSISKQLECG